MCQCGLSGVDGCIIVTDDNVFVFGKHIKYYSEVIGHSARNLGRESLFSAPNCLTYACV